MRLDFTVAAILSLAAVSGVKPPLAVQAADISEPRVLHLEGDISPVHDPAIIKEGHTYYVLASNWFHRQLVPVFCSQDLRAWKFCGHVFDTVPQWALQEIPGARGVWAPDISYADGQFRLYYAVSTFGGNHSVIGLATNKTLDPNAAGYHWHDEGRVIGTNTRDNWNAIDPDLATDEEGGAWLAMGSFWSGIKLRRIDPKTGKLSDKDTVLYSLADREPAKPPAIEAPFIVRHGEYFYLFVSFDLCCRGKASTYKIMVGRSRKITGPYVDESGRPMLEGGGTLLMESSPVWRGPGGQSILRDPDSGLMVFHAYDSETGRPFLRISTMLWKDGWPQAGALARSRPQDSQSSVQ